MAEEIDLSSLMAAAQKGDEAAYRTLLEAVQPVLMRYVGRRLFSENAVEDVCQNILLTVHRVRHTYTPDRPFEPWLYAIAKSRLIDHFRRERRHASHAAGTEEMENLVAEPQSSGLERLHALLARLPDNQRRAFSMLKLEGLTTEQAADQEGISVSALKVRAHRAYTALKHALSDELD
ncbi:MAG: sigma-70 family RNA polymerase sigma factor [Candidatus Binatia bacterium]